MTNDVLYQTHERAVALIRRYLRAAEDARTPILRELAETFVGAREYFLRPDGTPDWGGRSYAYRQFVRGAYAAAGLTGPELPAVQSAVRYHAGAVLRERLTPDEQADYGLQAHTPRERSRDRRAANSAALAAMKGRESAGGSLIALTTAFTLLNRLDAAELADLPDREREVALATLADVERRAAQVRRAVT